MQSRKLVQQKLGVGPHGCPPLRSGESESTGAPSDRARRPTRQSFPQFAPADDGVCLPQILSGAWGWANLSPGVTYRNTRLSASDPNNQEAGAHTYFNGEVDGAYNLSSAWRVRGLASYTPQTKDYFIQTGIDRSVLEWLRFGIGPTFQGGHDYSEVSGGVTAYIQVMDGFEIAPSVGVSHSDSGETGPYGAITFVIVGH